MRFHLADLGPRFKAIEVVSLSDIHVGHPDHAPKVLAREIRWLQEQPNRFAVLNGDMTETALIDSVGDVYDQTLDPQAQADYVAEALMPVKDRILAAVSGNHEHRVTMRTSFDPARHYARALGVPYESDAMCLAIRFGAFSGGERKNPKGSKMTSFLAYFTHGWGAARTIGAKLSNAALLRNVVSNCDMYFIAHTHQAGHFPLDVYEVDLAHRQLHRRTQHFISTGSALDYASYAARKGYSPTTMTFPKVHLSIQAVREPSRPKTPRWVKRVQVLSGD